MSVVADSDNLLCRLQREAFGEISTFRLPRRGTLHRRREGSPRIDAFTIAASPASKPLTRPEAATKR